MRRLNPITILVSVLLLAGVVGCNGTELEGVGGPVLGTGDSDDDRTDVPGVNPDDPHNGNDNVPPPETVPGQGDDDGDGIPNEDDFIPCMAFYVKVWNQEVSSGEVALNEQVIVDSSWFPTEEIFQEFINPVPGVNVVDFGGKVAGSPEDQLHTEVWSTQQVMYLHETIVRGNGQPEEVTVTFEIDVQC